MRVFPATFLLGIKAVLLGDQVEVCGIWDVCLAGSIRESDSFVFSFQNATAIKQSQNSVMIKQLITGERGDAHTL